MHIVLGICLVCALLGVAAGYFLSIYVVIVLAVVGGIWFSMISWGKNEGGHGTSGSIGLVLVAFFIAIFVLAMVITAIAVRINSGFFDWPEVGSWLKNVFLR